MVVAALFGVQLKKFRDRPFFTADVAAARAFQAIRTAKSEDQFGRGFYIAHFCG